MENNIEQIKLLIRDEVRRQLATGLFTARKVTDIPIDDLQVTPRGYVNLNGTTANRPNNPSQGQQYFDNTIGQPIFWNSHKSPAAHWVDANGDNI